jgi:CRP/FNR family transcriptional regulator, nitrogen fixation regulation protein
VSVDVKTVGVALLIRTTTRTSGISALVEFGLTSGANQAVLLNEFSYKKGTEIYGEKEPADYVYQVKIGAVRSYKLLSDGRRQIGAFHLVGDIFGLASGENHRFTAEAVVDTTVRLIKRQKLEWMAKTDAVLTRNLLSVTASDLRHAEDHMLLLGRKDALERVATFLLEMDKRLTGAGAITLPMSRHDIADYLGLTLETVSRSLSRLRRKGALSLTGGSQREITILDREQLRSLDS